MEYFPFFTVSLMVWLMASLDMEAEDLSIFTMEPCDGIHSICQVLHIQAGTSAAITVIISAVTVAVSAI